MTQEIECIQPFPNVVMPGTVDGVIDLLQRLKVGGVAGTDIVVFNDATFGKCRVGGAIFGGDTDIVELQVDDDAEPLEPAVDQTPDGAVKDAEIARLNAIINTPQSGDFLRAVSIEAEHQRQRWDSAYDVGKAPSDWFWLIGYLAGKALHAHASGDLKKAEHHIITSAAALFNWHLSMFGGTEMRPGIDPAKYGPTIMAELDQSIGELSE